MKGGDDMTTRGEALRREREKKGMTVAELSYAARVTTSAIYALERGASGGTADTWAKLAKGLDINISKLVG